MSIKFRTFKLYTLLCFSFCFLINTKLHAQDNGTFFEKISQKIINFEKQEWQLWKVQVNEAKSGKTTSMDILDNANGEYTYLIVLVLDQAATSPKLNLYLTQGNGIVNKDAGNRIGDNLVKEVRPAKAQGLKAVFDANYLLNEREIYYAKVAFIVLYKDK